MVKPQEISGLASNSAASTGKRVARGARTDAATTKPSASRKSTINAGKAKQTRTTKNSSLSAPVQSMPAQTRYSLRPRKRNADEDEHQSQVNGTAGRPAKRRRV
jgi:hypothetical protein